MNIAGMTRISSYDIDKKKCADEMKYCIAELAKHCNTIHFMIIGDVDDNFLNWLDVNKIITKTQKTYGGEGWYFDWTQSMTDLLDTIDGPYDWILMPDTDDALQPNILEEVEKANADGADMLDCPVLECFGGLDKVICKFDDGYPIGPHVKAFKYAKDLTFIGSSGFSKLVSKTGRELKMYNSLYPCRHVRYSRPELVHNRKSISYWQEYFEKPHPTVTYDPTWTFRDYIKHGKNL